ncbi:hypothetical protein C8R43DRAFT_965622 [Mycena crocata]|nr:hypothetical protein C8R43DRAFT_965622 [Mycena crocata]
MSSATSTFSEVSSRRPQNRHHASRRKGRSKGLPKVKPQTNYSSATSDTTTTAGTSTDPQSLKPPSETVALIVPMRPDESLKQCALTAIKGIQDGSIVVPERFTEPGDQPFDHQVEIGKSLFSLVIVLIAHDRLPAKSLSRGSLTVGVISSLIDALLNPPCALKKIREAFVSRAGITILATKLKPMKNRKKKELMGEFYASLARLPTAFAVQQRISELFEPVSRAVCRLADELEPLRVHTAKVVLVDIASRILARIKDDTQILTDDFHEDPGVAVQAKFSRKHRISPGKENDLNLLLSPQAQPGGAGRVRRQSAGASPSLLVPPLIGKPALKRRKSVHDQPEGSASGRLGDVVNVQMGDVIPTVIIQDGDGGTDCDAEVRLHLSELPGPGLLDDPEHDQPQREPEGDQELEQRFIQNSIIIATLDPGFFTSFRALKTKTWDVVLGPANVRNPIETCGDADKENPAPKDPGNAFEVYAAGLMLDLSFEELEVWVEGDFEPIITGTHNGWQAFRKYVFPDPRKSGLVAPKESRTRPFPIEVEGPALKKSKGRRPTSLKTVPNNNLAESGTYTLGDSSSRSSKDQGGAAPNSVQSEGVGSTFKTVGDVSTLDDRNSSPVVAIHNMAITESALLPSDSELRQFEFIVPDDLVTKWKVVTTEPQAVAAIDGPSFAFDIEKLFGTSMQSWNFFGRELSWFVFEHAPKAGGPSTSDPEDNPRTFPQNLSATREASNKKPQRSTDSPPTNPPYEVFEAFGLRFGGSGWHGTGTVVATGCIENAISTRVGWIRVELPNHCGGKVSASVVEVASVHVMYVERNQQYSRVEGHRITRTSAANKGSEVVSYVYTDENWRNNPVTNGELRAWTFGFLCLRGEREHTQERLWWKEARHFVSHQRVPHLLCHPMPELFALWLYLGLNIIE